MKLYLGIVILFLACSQNNSNPFAYKYIAIIDAGSTGSRAYVYQLIDAGSNTKAPIITAIGSCKDPDPNCKQTTNNDKGIATLTAAKQADMDTYLNPLINFIKSKIPSNEIANTKIILGATAGTRNLAPVEFQTQIMSLASNTLNSVGFYSGTAKIISGFSEGVYSWLNVNSALNLLGQSQDKTYGIIEMGGASEQITFIPSEQANSFPIRITGQQYTLYSYSYNHLGANEAISMQDGSHELEGCTATTADTSADYTKCKASWAKILNQNFACVPLCGLEGVNQPTIPPNMSFKMLGGTARGIAQSCSLTSYQPQNIDSIGNTVCTNTQPPSTTTGTPKPCENFKGKPAYLCKLLALLSTEISGQDDPSTFKGFGFKNTTNQIEATDGTINGQEITWTHGMAIGELIGIAPK